MWKKELQVNVPSFFRCPISLDVMKSPVSLCTGVTYDRSSIERWLAAGNNTCPATMQVLPTTDLVPNHTLQRLIQIWSRPTTTTTPVAHNTQDLVLHLSSDEDPLPSLRKLASMAKDQDGVDRLVKNDSCVAALNGVIAGKGSNDLEAMDLAVRVLALILDKSKDNDIVIKPLLSASSPETISSLLVLIKNENTSTESKTNALNVLRKISSLDAESKLVVAGMDGILKELARLLVAGCEHETSKTTMVDACLSCLICLSSPKRTRSQIFRLGVITSLGKLLSHESIQSETAEKALKLLKTASTCTEGRAAICKEADVVVSAVVGRMMKVSTAATEHAVVVLWSVRHVFRDQKAQEALAGSNGLTKILLLMQSNCSPAARQMAGDLLRIFRVNFKSCLASYDPETTHITPF